MRWIRNRRALVGITLAFLLFVLGIFLSAIAITEQLNLVQPSQVLGISAVGMGLLAFITFIASAAAKIRHELIV